MAIQATPIASINLSSNYQRVKRLVDILFTLLMLPFLIIVTIILQC